MLDLCYCLQLCTIMFVITRCAFTAKGKSNHTRTTRTVNAFYHLLTKNTLVHYCKKVIGHTHHAYVQCSGCCQLANGRSHTYVQIEHWEQALITQAPPIPQIIPTKWPQTSCSPIIGQYNADSLLSCIHLGGQHNSLQAYTTCPPVYLYCID